MESLQIQDAFQPYYAERANTANEARKERSKGAATVSTADVRAKLLACRNRLAQAIAAAEANEH